MERHSPMEINWKDKWLSFDYQNESVKLQGIVPENVHCELISKELATLESQDKIWCVLELQTV